MLNLKAFLPTREVSVVYRSVAIHSEREVSIYGQGNLTAFCRVQEWKLW